MMDANITQQLAQQVCSDQGFTHVELVGRGAYKHTFRVVGPEGPLALKLITGDIDSSRIIREIDALQACSHSNICRLLNVGSIAYDGREIVYLVEEFLGGGTLTERLSTNGLLTREETAHLGFELGKALAHLAERHIVHRDIKPDNIMFHADGRPVLVDLGIVRQLNASSLTHTWWMQGPGTPLYASPEQLVNDKHLIDWRSDQFSLGVTLSFAAIGIHPYAGDASPSHAIDRMTRRDRPTALFNDMADSAGLQILQKMVEPWPIKRYTKPEDLIDAWQNWGRAK